MYQPAPLSDFVSGWPMLATGVPRVVQAALSHREAPAADTAAQVVPHLLQLGDPLLEQRSPCRGHPRPVPLAGGGPSRLADLLTTARVRTGTRRWEAGVPQALPCSGRCVRSGLKVVPSDSEPLLLHPTAWSPRQSRLGAAAWIVAGHLESPSPLFRALPMPCPRLGGRKLISLKPGSDCPRQPSGP